MPQKGYTQILIEKINALAELERYNWPYEPIGNDEVKIKCPFPGHNDANPSASLNTSKNLWVCHTAGCNGKGTIINLLSLILQVDQKWIKDDLSKRYDLNVIRVFDPKLIEEYHQAIWTAGPLLQELENRCIGKDLIRKARIGYDKKTGRITIPIFNTNGQAINLRRYLPGATEDKYKHARGLTSTALYMPDQLKYDTIWICGGELKALAISPYLNKINVGAVAVTGGEGTWNKDLTKLIEGRTIFLAMDIDGPGRKASNIVASQIKGAVIDVRIVELPLDQDEFPKGDINDWLYHKKPTDDDFQKVIAAARRFEFPTEFGSSSNGQVTIDATLNSAVNPDNIGKPLRMKGVVSGIDMIPFMLPKEVKVHCSQDQGNCHKCPIRSYKFDEEEGVKITIDDDSYGILETFSAPKDKQKKPIQRTLGIPYCAAISFNVVSYYSVYECRITPHLSLRNVETEDYRVQPGLIVTTDSIELNTPYSMVGRIYPDPKTQQAMLVINKISPTSDSLNSCVITQDELSSLTIFRPENWSVESLTEKLDDLYADLSANVTRIYKRFDLHLALDLAWCSTLYFNFDGRQQNGWVNLLVMGDSALGKTETSLRLMEHYGLGVKYDCKNSSVAGLLGGVEIMGQRRFIVWGVIPTNDRRLVVLEEMKGAAKEVISQLTDMRSSGMAEITKIERRKAHARTRLIMISNPRSNRSIASYNHGIEAIEELVGAPEDVRRYDLAVILSNNDIPAKELNILTSLRPQVEHTFTSELCKLNILWGWTRKKDEIFFEKEAINLCLSSAIELCEIFAEEIPLIDRATTKFKIARLAVALAVRTFSTNGTYDTVIVRKCHVEYIKKFLIRLYTSDSFGYDNFTEAIKFQNEVIDPEDIQQALLETPYPKDLIEQLLNSNNTSMTDFMDWVDLDRDASRSLISLLVRKHALKREGSGYFKTIGFISLLRKMQRDKKDVLNNKVEVEL